jgi:hypothetical protein
MRVRCGYLFSMAMCSIPLLLGSSAALAQEAVRCQVAITTPQPGDKVGKEGKVRGTATIPRGAYLWVLVHMKDLVTDWWPQGNHATFIAPGGGKWVIIARYGRAKDIGEEFEVAAVVVDANTNAQLLDWFKTAKEKDYPPIEFPSTVQGCVPARVTVTKTSH